jgi:hypothetical protein
MSDFQLDCLTVRQCEQFLQLIQSPEWQMASSLRDQIGLAVATLHFGSTIVSFGQLGKVFKKNKGTVYRAYEKTLTERKPNGHPPLLSPTQQQAVQQFIAERWDKGIPPTFDAISNFIDHDLHIVIPIGTVRHLIHNLPGTKVITGNPMERVEVRPEELVDFYDRLRPVMTGLSSDLVYNLDESGSQEWADRTDIKVVVPNSFEPDVMDVTYNRAIKPRWEKVSASIG